MALISTRTHAAGDYAGGAIMLLSAAFMRDRRAAALLRLAGAGTLAASASTDYELGIWRKLPMPVHLALDAATGAVMTTGALLLRRRGGTGLGSWLPPMMIGAGELAGAALTERRAPGAASSAPASADAGWVPRAPAPVETPGPSVTPPAQPESDVERAERIDAGLPAQASGDELVAQQEAAAAAEAAAIGGASTSETGDAAMDPVYEAGGGEQDGWEAAEADLIENAAHGDGGGNPERDALTPEIESDRSTAVYGEADDIPATEMVEDPRTSEDDPGQGPGLAAER
jgi:hypothetical protein